MLLWKHKILFLVSVFVVLIILGGGAWFWFRQEPNFIPTVNQPLSQKETAGENTIPVGRKRYTNSILGITFLYPENSTIAFTEKIDNSGRLGPQDGNLLSIEIDSVVFDIFTASAYSLNSPGGWVYWNAEKKFWMNADSYGEEPYTPTFITTEKGVRVYEIPSSAIGYITTSKIIVGDNKIFVFSVGVEYNPDEEGNYEKASAKLRVLTSSINDIVKTFEFLIVQ